MKQSVIFFFILFSVMRTVNAQSWQVCSDSIYSNTLQGDNETALKYLELAENDLANIQVKRDTVYADFLYRKGLLKHFTNNLALELFIESYEIWKSSGHTNNMKFLKLNFFIGESFDNQHNYNTACKYYKSVITLNDKNNLEPNINYRLALERLMLINAYKLQDKKEAKKFATIYLDKIHPVARTYNSYTAYEILGDFDGQEKVLLELIDNAEKKLAQDEGGIELIKWLVHLYIDLTGVYYHTNEYLKGVEVGEKTIQMQEEYDLPKNELIYRRLSILYDSVKDISNTRKYDELLRLYFPDNEDEIDFYDELNLLISESKYKEFHEKFKEYESILIKNSDFNELLRIYGLSLTLFEQSILFSKSDIDEQISLIDKNKKRLNKENKVLFLFFLAEYNFFIQDLPKSLFYAEQSGKKTNNQDIRLKALKIKSISEVMLGLSKAKNTVASALNLAKDKYGNESPQILEYIQSYLFIKQQTNSFDEDDLAISSKALEIIYNNKLENTELAALIANVLGTINFAYLNYDDALYYLNWSNRILENIGVNTNIYIYYSNLLVIARYHIYQGNFSEAHKILVNVHKLLSETENIMDIAWGDYSEIVGYYYLFQDDLDKAEESFRKAYEIYGENLSALRLVNLYIIDYFKTGNYLNLLQFYKENGDLLNASLYIYLNKYNKEDINEAREFLVEHLTKAIENYKQVLPRLSKTEQEGFIEGQRNKFGFLNSLLLGHQGLPFLTDYLNIRFFYKSLLLNNTKTKAFDTYSDYYIEYQDNNTLINLMLEAENTQPEFIDSLKFRNRELEKFFSKNNTPTQTPTLKEVNSSLKSNQAMVEIIRINKQKRNKDATVEEMILEQFSDSIYYAAIIIKKDQAPSFILIDEDQVLESKIIADYNQYTYGEKRSDVDTISYRYLFEKIDAELNGITEIFLSTDGIYNTINVQNLYNPHTNKYLIEYLKIRQINSVKEIVNKISDQQLEDKNAILFGNPAFTIKLESELIESKTNIYSQNSTDSIQSLLNTRGGIISSLPGTEVEIRDIKDILKKNHWEVRSFDRENASEANLKAVSNPDVLHIATHGFYFDATKPNRHQKRYLGYEISKLNENIYLRSGLLLTGAQNHLEGHSLGINNGIFTAQEAKSLNLTNTKLVVLSACETGLGENKVGDGIYGLQRAFMMAGAENVLMSLWKVDDEATQKLMTSFYKNWIEKSMSKHEALRQAKLELKEIYTEPYYWSGFILIE